MSGWEPCCGGQTEAPSLLCWLHQSAPVHQVTLPERGWKAELSECTWIMEIPWNDILLEEKARKSLKKIQVEAGQRDSIFLSWSQRGHLLHCVQSLVRMPSLLFTLSRILSTVQKPEPSMRLSGGHTKYYTWPSLIRDPPAGSSHSRVMMERGSLPTPAVYSPRLCMTCANMLPPGRMHNGDVTMWNLNPLGRAGWHHTWNEDKHRFPCSPLGQPLQNFPWSPSSHLKKIFLLVYRGFTRLC